MDIMGDKTTRAEGSNNIIIIITQMGFCLPKATATANFLKAPILSCKDTRRLTQKASGVSNYGRCATASRLLKMPFSFLEEERRLLQQ
jgi:hypothetical protein